MAGPAGSRDPGHEAHDPHGQVRVGDRVGYLVEGSPGGEHPEGVHERDVSAPGKRPGKAHHVRLGHATVHESVGNLLLEQVDFTLPREISTEAKDFRTVAGEIYQCPAVGLELGQIGRLTHAGPPVWRSAPRARPRPAREAT